jgi:Flp pilus assembly protein TadD
MVGLILLTVGGIGFRLLTGGEETTAAPGDPSTPAVAVLGVDSPWSGDDVPTAEERNQPTFSEAERAYMEERYLDAFELFSSFVELHPENARGHYMVGLSALHAGFHEEAELGFLAALGRDPGHVKSRLNLARLALDAGRPQDALDHVSEALRREPSDPEAQRLLGRVQHTLGRYAAAEAAYRKAVALDPNEVWAMNNLGYLYIEQGRFSEALAPLARAVELAGHVALFRSNLGVALEKMGRYREASEAYRAAVENDPGNSRAAVNLARAERLAATDDHDALDLAAMASQFAEDTAILSSARAEVPVPAGAVAPPVAVSP